MHKVLKVAKNRGQDRIWIERGNLLRAGIHCGDVFTLEIQGDAILLTFASCMSTKHRVRRVAGSDARPIIDVNNRELTAFFDGATHYRATFGLQRIIITREVVA